MTVKTTASRKKQNWHVSGTNLEQAKSHNRRLVIETLRAFSPMSRADITHMTALTAQTVSNIVAELLRDGWLRETRVPQMVRGSSVPTYEINPYGGYSIGIEIIDGMAHGLACDLSGHVMDKVEIAVREPSGHQAIDLARQIVLQLSENNPQMHKKTLGVGFVFPGRYNHHRVSYVKDAIYPGWRDLAIGPRLEEALGLPVLIDNDAAAAGVHERLYGCTQNIPDFAMIYLAQGGGIGASLFTGGQFYRGHNGNAGEIGRLDPGTGTAGATIESAVDTQGLHRALGLAPLAPETAEALASTLAIHAPELARWAANAAPALNRLIAFFEMAVDPEAIVIGGSIDQSIANALVRAINSLRGTQPRHLETGARIISGTCGRNAAALGAAALPVFSQTNTQFQILQKPHEA